MFSLSYTYSHNSLSTIEFLIAAGIGIIIGLVIMWIIYKNT